MSVADKSKLGRWLQNLLNGFDTDANIDGEIDKLLGSATSDSVTASTGDVTATTGDVVSTAGSVKAERTVVQTKTIAISSFTAATTHVLSAAIPAKSLLVGISTYISTQPAGPTTIDIGDGTDADGYIVDQAVAATTAATSDGALIGTFYPAAQDITMTAVGSDFTGVGVMNLYVHYISLDAPTS